MAAADISLWNRAASFGLNPDRPEPEFLRTPRAPTGKAPFDCPWSPVRWRSTRPRPSPRRSRSTSSIGRPVTASDSKEELENVALKSTRTIEIDEFVDRSEIDPRYLIRPHYLRPDGKVGMTLLP